jgi:hypothetical protein
MLNTVRSGSMYDTLSLVCVLMEHAAATKITTKRLIPLIVGQQAAIQPNYMMNERPFNTVHCAKVPDTLPLQRYPDIRKAFNHKSIVDNVIGFFSFSSFASSTVPTYSKTYSSRDTSTSKTPMTSNWCRPGGGHAGGSILEAVYGDIC